MISGLRNWTTSEWLAFLAIIAAIIIGVAAILATRTWGNRRGKVLVAYSSTRLLAVKPAADELKVTFNDAPVNNPHLLSLVLKNIGSRDITREQFDGRSLSIELNCPYTGSCRSKVATGVQPTLTQMRTIMAWDSFSLSHHTSPRAHRGESIASSRALPTRK